MKQDSAKEEKPERVGEAAARILSFGCRNTVVECEMEYIGHCVESDSKEGR